jgi:hypothetical protein
MQDGGLRESPGMSGHSTLDNYLLSVFGAKHLRDIGPFLCNAAGRPARCRLRSVGATDDGREVYLVWRWDIFDPERVFPITAYFLPDEG